MAFVVRIIFLSALVYTTKAGLLTSSGHHGLSTSYGPPSNSYGPPDLDTHSHGGYESQGSYDSDDGHQSAPLISEPAPPLHTQASFGPSLSAPAPLDTSFAGPALSAPSYPAPSYSGPSYSGPSYPASDLPGPGLPVQGPTGLAGPGLGASLGAPRVIGSTVSVGRPIAAATRYELQAVVQDVIRRVPVEVTRHVQVAVPHPVPVPVRQEVKVPVPQPYPVHVDVVKHVPYPVYKTQHVEVERPVPVEVVRHVPFEVIRKVPVPVEKPYEVIKKVHIPIEKRIEVPVAVWKPYPIHIIKHVTHYKKKKWW